MNGETRKPIPDPEYYGIERGYWGVYTELDEFSTPKPLGIYLVIQFTSEHLEFAEDAALEVGIQFAQILAAYSGSPLPLPSLKRLARVGDADGTLEHHEYYYLDGRNALPHVMLEPERLDNLLKWVSVLKEESRDRLELAARWYGMCIGAADSLDGYLAAWIGLESVGPALDDRVHAAGPKAPCEVCANAAGVNRKRGDAGIEHAIKEVAPEVFVGRSLVDLKNIRNDIAHSLKSSTELRQDADTILPDLQLALIFAILTAVRPESSAPGSGHAQLPREFKPFPEGRHTTTSKVELLKHKPYFEEWLTVTREFQDESTHAEKDGNYVWGAQTLFKVQGYVPEEDLELEKTYCLFKRLGRKFEDKGTDSDLPNIPVIAWRDVPLTDAWQRYMSQAEE